jgi:DNA replication protein DnaC
MNNAIRDEIASHCRRLRLRRLTEHLDDIHEESHEAFLLELLRREVVHRDAARVERSIKAAGFYAMKSLEDFVFGEVTLPAAVSMESLADLRFIEDRHNLILYGNVGTGKTHLATALGIEACRRRYKVQFWRTAALVNYLLRIHDGGDLQPFLKQIEKLDLLVCDEWGYVPVHRTGAQLLFQVISACYEKRSPILTTNLEFSKWVNIFLDEAMTTAMIDRLIHHSHLLIFDGESHRVKNSLMRR